MRKHQINKNQLHVGLREILCSIDIEKELNLKFSDKEKEKIKIVKSKWFVYKNFDKKIQWEICGGLSM